MNDRENGVHVFDHGFEAKCMAEKMDLLKFHVFDHVFSPFYMSENPAALPAE